MAFSFPHEGTEVPRDRASSLGSHCWMMVDQDTKPRSSDYQAYGFYVLCFSIGWGMEEEKKQRRKEKRHNGTFLPTEGLTSSPHSGPALSSSWDILGPSANREDWPFISGNCTQSFAFCIHFLSICVQIMGALLSHCFYYAERPYCLLFYKILLSKSYAFRHFFEWFLKLDRISVLQSLKA